MSRVRLFAGAWLLAVALLSIDASVQAQQQPEPAPVPGGAVIFSRNDDTPVAPVASTRVAPVDSVMVTDAERESLHILEYDLDVHLTPASARIETRARMTVRNDGTQPISLLALQISSSLLWESVSIEGATAKAAPVQQIIDSDADHTGKVREVVVSLATPLEVGRTVRIDSFYSGTIPQDGSRLERIGAPHEQALLADWDQISAEATSLRGFGTVVWYPVAAAPAFLGEGAKLFEAVARARSQGAASLIRLRLTVAFTGDAPNAVFFCSQRNVLSTVREDQDLPVAESPGVATVEFPVQPLGFRVPSLFLTGHAASVEDSGLLQIVTDHYDALPAYVAAADRVKPLLDEWLGPQTIGPLNILDQPGQAFEDDSLLVRPVRAVSGDDTLGLNLQMAHSLTHAWFKAPEPWLDEGVAQFMTLLWVERSQSREAAQTLLATALQPLTLIEPAPDAGKESVGGQPLVSASSEAYFRGKASAVLWMLRSVVGDPALEQALTVYRRSSKDQADTHGFQHVLERMSGRDLRWLFDDWIYRDRGLPDLSIVSVAPRQTTAVGKRAAGFLVAVEVHNDGGAVAEVPVTVRSGALSATEKLRILPHSNASTRIVFEGTPEEVLVNDGSVPELRTATHRETIRITH